jgi:hypothetical protein
MSENYPVLPSALPPVLPQDPSSQGPKQGFFQGLFNKVTDSIFGDKLQHPEPKEHPEGTSLTKKLSYEALGLIPGVYPWRLYKEKKYVQAAVWTIVDAATLAAFIIPPLGMALEGTAGATKMGLYASKAMELAKTLKIAEKVPQAAKAAEAAKTALPTLKKIKPLADAVNKASSIKRLEKKGQAVERMKGYLGGYGALKTAAVVTDDKQPNTADKQTQNIKQTMKPGGASPAL